MYGQELSIGAQVRIQGFPRPTDPNNHLNFNGLVGTIVKVYKVPFGSGRIAGMSYEYDVEFKDVNVKRAVLDPKTRKLNRSTARVNAVQTFNESYVELVSYPHAQQSTVSSDSFQGTSMPMPPKPTAEDLPPLPDNMPLPNKKTKKQEVASDDVTDLKLSSEDTDFPEVETDFFFTNEPENNENFNETEDR